MRIAALAALIGFGMIFRGGSGGDGSGIPSYPKLDLDDISGMPNNIRANANVPVKESNVRQMFQTVSGYLGQSYVIMEKHISGLVESDLYKDGLVNLNLPTDVAPYLDSGIEGSGLTGIVRGSRTGSESTGGSMNVNTNANYTYNSANDRNASSPTSQGQ